LDLNRILLYADPEGSLKSTPRRKLFCLVDAILAGEQEGPMRPKDKRCGAILAGTNALVVDTVAAKFMGLTWESIPQLTGGFGLSAYPIFAGTPDMIQVAGEETVPYSEWRPDTAPFLVPAGWQVLNE
jgi:hypothetical protein